MNLDSRIEGSVLENLESGYLRDHDFQLNQNMSAPSLGSSMRTIGYAQNSASVTIQSRPFCEKLSNQSAVTK